MVFKRLYNVLRSNLNSGSSGKVKSTFQSFDSTSNPEPEKEQNMDPVTRKELEYLSNLEMKKGASFEEIKASYKKLIKQYHPDKFHGNEEQRKFAEEVTSRLNEAFAYFEEKNKQQKR